MTFEIWDDDYTPKYPFHIDRGNSKRHLCCWPGCDTFGVCEMRVGEQMPMKQLCKAHREWFREASFWDVEAIDWQPKRLVRIRTHRPRGRTSA